MTYNQIQYWNLQESKRHNYQTEREQALSRRSQDRHFKRSDANQAYANAETARSNRAKENFNISDLAERSRANAANEYLKGTQLSIEQQKANETARANQAAELQKQLELKEQKVRDDIEKIKADATKERVDSQNWKDQTAADYYIEQSKKIEAEIDRLWQQFEHDKKMDYLEMIEKYIKDLILLPGKVKGAKG